MQPEFEKLETPMPRKLPGAAEALSCHPSCAASIFLLNPAVAISRVVVRQFVQHGYQCCIPVIFGNAEDRNGGTALLSTLLEIGAHAAGDPEVPDEEEEEEEEKKKKNPDKDDPEKEKPDAPPSEE